MELIVLTQPNCAPCKMVKQYLTENNIEFKALDLTDDPSLATEYGIMSTPVTILVEDGEELARTSGFAPPELNDLASNL